MSVNENNVVSNSNTDNASVVSLTCTVGNSIEQGDVIDVCIADEWKLRYGSVDRIEQDGVVFTMRYPAHDGCYWSYKYAFDKVRVSTKTN